MSRISATDMFSPNRMPRWLGAAIALLILTAIATSAMAAPPETPAAPEPATASPDVPEETSAPPESEAPAAESSEPNLPIRPSIAASGIAEEWRHRIDELEAQTQAGERGAEDADRLFEALHDVLWPYLRSVRTSVVAASPGFVEEQASLDDLYAQRERLFELISPELRGQLVRAGPVGRAALRNELAYLRTSLLGQVRAIQRGLRQVAENVQDSPLTAVWRALQVLFAIVVFRGWRRWSKQGLVSARARLLEEMSPARVKLGLARVLWYLNRINGPLSWLLLVFAFSRLVNPRGFEELADLVYAILLWILVARLAVVLIDAMAVHGIGGLQSERRGLRLRTLRLLAFWSVLLGLGLGLIDRWVGYGAMYAWGLRIWQILSLPVVLLVIYWWRDEIFERLEGLSDHSPMARSLSSTRKGIWSYPVVVFGAGYLIWAGALKRLIFRVSHFEGGRRALAVLVRAGVEEKDGLSADKAESAIPTEVEEGLLSTSGALLESVAHEQLDIVMQSLRARQGGASVVLAERGGGKSTFLARLAEALDGAMRVVDCPIGGYEEFENVLAAEFGVPAADAGGEALLDAIEAAGVRVLGIDNSHHLARPYMGGQQGLDRMAALDARMKGRVSWLLAIDRNAWRYILLGRGERELFQEVVELPRWTEAQLQELVAGRSSAVGIDLDYTRFILPRQLDTGEHEGLEERNRFGYARILWELSDGNPETAIRLFARSLRSRPNDRSVVHLPQPRFSVPLNDARVATLLVLRVILQCDVASVEDVARSLHISQARALASVRFCLQNGWLEEVDGGLRLSWEWYPTITRLLERKNLMPR